MTSLAPAIGLVLVAAITPGPNNLVVLRAAARGGIPAAIPAIAGAVAGGLVLLGVVAAGAGRAFAAHPDLRASITLAGGAYLAWLGVRMVVRPERSAADPAAGAPTRAGAAMFAFQLMNPKAWVMVLTATAATPGALVPLVAVFAVIPFACLTLWSAFGAYGARRWHGTSAGRALDRVLGAALVASAVALIAGA